MHSLKISNHQISMRPCLTTWCFLKPNVKDLRTLCLWLATQNNLLWCLSQWIVLSLPAIQHQLTEASCIVRIPFHIYFRPLTSQRLKLWLSDVLHSSKETALTLMSSNRIYLYLKKRSCCVIFITAKPVAMMV